MKAHLRHLAPCLLLAAFACTHTIDDCSEPNDNPHCPPLEAGVDAGLDAAPLVDAAVDAPTDAPATDAGDADVGPCVPPCSGDTPHCRESDGGGECVACLIEEHCGGGRCNTDGACVECLENADCDDSSRARCDETSFTCEPCDDSAQCARYPETPACSAEAGCVPCTQDNAAACEGRPCRPDNTCSDFPSENFACSPCDTDLNCPEGQLCVEMFYADPPPERSVGHFCQWRRDALGVGAPNGECAEEDINSRPWQRLQSITSIDGVSADICTLATTTCVARRQHRQAVAGCTIPGTDDGACGVEGLNDGRCRLSPGGNPRCTYPCLGTEDCPGGSTCLAGDEVCSL